jgi:hypothetical protein
VRIALRGSLSQRLAGSPPDAVLPTSIRIVVGIAIVGDTVILGDATNVGTTKLRTTNRETQ